MKTIKEIQAEVHQNAIEHGWWEEKREFGTMIALCHSELSEALEEVRKGREINKNYYTEQGKLEGVPSELADVVIRILDMCGYYNIDLQQAIIEKNEFNKKREFKHNKQF
ncbi:NTP pyrophosphatase (non-canonical NTP hydrolase) [Paenibacillus sp. SORGH_AS306]|uniref:hypothetical protein n=1 Tax=unclassified Paenibacillus TaxID=185978 RepID=UPI0023672B53|nr:MULTISPECIES: hypothetical protein [unclassified Paenibacillus]MDQ1234641.1 NTP pyrophosphatase (non-canonical NTP hydrolase) [Paenibacillus sp. SORGH_AS_0306]MDR6111686.1 NTP pyrophosphatase (non-canonical NTP hydrolase) [Paenibacillus sp. SORGH_AS_0338]WDF52633.1 hypothetical protein PQ460_09565 [Paenibacillus sp. KACC 21273]